MLGAQAPPETTYWARTRRPPLCTGGQRMSGTRLTALGELSFSGQQVSYVIVAVAIALVALGFAAALVRVVLSAGKGTQKMQEIAGAVQEGAQAYLLRQFKTLGIFVVIAVVVLFLLPVNDVVGSVTSVKIGRSIFFIVGAVFSAFIGGAGMALATRANLRVAAAARGGDVKKGTKTDTGKNRET